MSNSNFNITKVVVDPISQEISSLEVNGKPIETGSEANLQVGLLNNIRAGDSGILEPDDEYDGFSYVEYEVEQTNLENIAYDSKTPLNVGSLFGENPSRVQIDTSAGWDGIASVDIYPGGLTGYPTLPSTLYSGTFVECTSEGGEVQGGESFSALLDSVEGEHGAYKSTCIFKNVSGDYVYTDSECILIYYESGDYYDYIYKIGGKYFK